MITEEFAQMTPTQRWEEGIDHEPESLEIEKFIKANDPHGIWDFGGDGDNGEDLLYLLDCYFTKKAFDVEQIMSQLRGGGLTAFQVGRASPGKK